MTVGNVMPRGNIPSLDGIRALAVSLVFFAHSGLEHVIPGGLGVTIFFVLSGYLISTLIRSEHASRNSIDFRGFYLRRFLRLMPPLAIVVAACVVLASLDVIDGDFTGGGLASVLFYFGNYFVIAHDFAGVPAGLAVVWSLAVEEHYYLFYPPLIALALAAQRRTLTIALLLALCASVLGWRIVLALNGASENYLTMATDTRVDAILFGCVLAFWRNPWLDPVPAPNRLRDSALIAGCVAVLLFTLAWRSELFRLTGRYTLQSAAVAVLLWFAVARAGQRPFRWLNARPLVYLGTISYSIYLSHHVILMALQKHWPQLGWLATTTAAAVLTLAFAEPMRRFVEAPCARLRKRLHELHGAPRSGTDGTPAKAGASTRHSRVRTAPTTPSGAL
jgi:peptidoglycan/LPS O-acetylase OafA/YrhL